MAELFWKAAQALARQRWTFAQESRLARFFGLSGLLHLALAATTPWLLLGFGLTGREERLLIREVDFVLPPETAEVGPRREVRGGGGGGRKPAAADRSPVRRAPTRGEARPAGSQPTVVTAASAPSPPPPAPAPTSTEPRESPPSAPTGDLPTQPPAPEPSAPPVPEPRQVASSRLRPPATAAERGATTSDSTNVAALIRQAATSPSLVATIVLPRALADGGGGGGGPGSGAGAGHGIGPGAGGAIGPGSGLIDMRDPDFSEYFRIIEQRVRAAWKFPEGLEGTTQTVKVGFSLRLDGGLEHARVVSSTSGALNESALLAMRRASPFPPLPAKFRALAGQPLVISFTVTIR